MLLSKVEACNCNYWQSDSLFFSVAINIYWELVQFLYYFFQDSKAYYHLLKQIAPKGDNSEETAIDIDLLGLNVCVDMYRYT